MYVNGRSSAAMKLAANCRVALKEGNLAPKDLAACAGLELGQVEAILEGGGEKVTLDVLGRLADCLGVSPSTLVS